MDELEFLKLPAVEQKTGRKKSALYADPDFPAPVHVGRSSFWIKHEVEDWMRRQIAASRREPSPAVKQLVRKKLSALPAPAYESTEVKCT